jgi:hypothetical protein
MPTRELSVLLTGDKGFKQFCSLVRQYERDSRQLKFREKKPDCIEVVHRFKKTAKLPSPGLNRGPQPTAAGRGRLPTPPPAPCPRPPASEAQHQHQH